jgi:hypothetical protein
MNGLLSRGQQKERRGFFLMANGCEKSKKSKTEGDSGV